MATLKITNNFELVSQGITVVGKAGAIADAADAQFLIDAVTITGNLHRVANTLATATVVTIYDDDDFPIDWDYGFFWADVDMYLQIIAGSTNCVFKVLAKVPFVIPGYDSILPAANSTLITGGTEPTMTDIDSIAVGNYSGGTGNYVLALMD